MVDEDYPLALDIWHRLIVNFTTTATTAFLAEEELFKDVPLIKLDKERRIEEVVIGEDLFGFVSNCFLASTTILPDRLPMKDYAQGASDWQRVLRLKEHKLSNNLLAGCFPFSRFQQRYQQYCFDPFRKYSPGDVGTTSVLGTTLSWCITTLQRAA